MRPVLDVESKPIRFIQIQRAQRWYAKLPPMTQRERVVLLAFRTAQLAKLKRSPWIPREDVYVELIDPHPYMASYLFYCANGFRDCYT